MICLAATSIEVIDGDTIHAAGLRVRLWGIDAAERDQIGGPAATAALTAIIAAADGLACNPIDQDRYGRTVARCDIIGGRADSHDLSCALVRSGHARDWPRYSGGAYSGCD